MALLLAPAAWLMAFGSPPWGHSSSTKEIVDVDPDSWVGTRLPLLDDIALPRRLDEGTWIVLLYKHGCSACREAVANYERFARQISPKPKMPRIALIACPPYGDEVTSAERPSYCIYGRLTGAKRWKLPTPMVLLVDEGRVKYVSTHDVQWLQTIWN